MAAENHRAAIATVNFPQKLRGMISDNSPDYDSWISLISEIETSSQDDIDTISLLYDSFLSKFPLCHWHLENYASRMAKLRGTQEAFKIYGRGAGVVMYSVGFWVDYFTFAMTYLAESEEVRRLFITAFSYVGKDYYCHALWDKYLKYEFNQQGWHYLAQSYIQVLRFPTKKLHYYYNNFKQFVVNLEGEIEYEKNHNVEEEQQSVSSATKLSRDEISLVIKDLLDSSDKSAMCKALDKYRYLGEVFYQEACQLNEKIKSFETNIRRRFFCVSPIDEDQLNNWHLYLDFVEKQENLDWAVKLYERCLIPCANYPEFWMRYVDYLESKRGRELAISALDRATKIFLKSVPEIHLFSARFKEHIGDVNGARASLLECNTGTDSCFLEKVAARASIERRLGNLAEASATYEEALKTAVEKQKVHMLPRLYSQYAWLTFKITGSADAARDILINAIRRIPHCRFLFEELIKFSITHEGADQLDIIDSIIVDAISPGLSEYDGMNAKDREIISCLFMEFVNLCGTVDDVRKAWSRHTKLFPQCLRSGVTIKHSRSGSSWIQMVRDQKEHSNVVRNQPSQNWPAGHALQSQFEKRVLEIPVGSDIHPNQDMENQLPQKDCTNNAEDTAEMVYTGVIVVPHKDTSPDDEPASNLLHQYCEDKQGHTVVNKVSVNESKGILLRSQETDQDFSRQFREEKIGPMDVGYECVLQPEKNALVVHDSAIRSSKSSGTTDPVEKLGRHSGIIDICSELDHEIKPQNQTVSLDCSSSSPKGKQAQELVPMSCDEYETKGCVLASGDCTAKVLSNANYNSFTSPSNHQTTEAPLTHNASKRYASVSQQNRTRTNIHSDSKELSRTDEDLTNLDGMVPVPDHTNSGLHEQEKEQKNPKQQSFTHNHHPACELDRKILMNQGNASINSAREDNIQVPGETVKTDSSGLAIHLSSVSDAQSPMSNQVSCPQQNTAPSTSINNQDPGLAHQDLTMNQIMQYHYHQQHLMQQHYQQQLQMQQSYLQMQHQYANHQQYQLQPQQQNQLNVHLVGRQNYVQDQQQQPRQQITSFYPFHQQIQHHQQNHQIVGPQQGHQPQLQELGFHMNQLGYHQHASAQGQQMVYPQYQHYQQGHLHQQQSQEGHLHGQEQVHQYPDHMQLDEGQKHEGHKHTPTDHDGAAESSKSPRSQDQ